jgi:hypothetical protein
MAIDATALSNLLTEVGTNTLTQATLDAWVVSLVALNQLNGEVIHELNSIHSTGAL